MRKYKVKRKLKPDHSEMEESLWYIKFFIINKIIRTTNMLIELDENHTNPVTLCCNI